MNGGGRLPKQATESNAGAPIASGVSKRLPRACFVLLILLCAQILFLAVVRIGPSSLRWEGKGAAIQAIASSHLSLIRNSFFPSGASMETEDLSADRESEVSSQTSASLPKAHRSRKEKSASHGQGAGKNRLMKDSKVSEAEKDADATPSLQSETSTDESSDEASDYVVDKFSSNTAETFYAGANSGHDDAPSEASVKSEGEQKDGSSVSGNGDARDREIGSLSMKKVANSSVVTDVHDQDASKSKQLTSETEARAVQDQDQGGGNTSKQEQRSENLKDGADRDVQHAEKAEKAIDIDASAELEVKKEEPDTPEQASESLVENATVSVLDRAPADSDVQQQASSVNDNAAADPGDEKKQQHPVVAKDVSKITDGKVEVAEEEGGVPRASEKEQQKLSTIDLKDPAPLEVTTKDKDTDQEKQEVLITEEASHDDAPAISGAEDGQSAKESQAMSEEIQSKHPPALVDQKASEQMSSSDCIYGYIYLYDLPNAFNHDIVSNCSSLNPWFNMCPILLNGGLGETLGKASPLGQEGSWYYSNHFMSEIVFHNRILQHKCLTDKIERASAFYVPFYAGLDVGRYLGSGTSVQTRDGLSNQFADWLVEQPAWKASGGGSDHFMMIGRMTWDFRRSKDEDWGSGFFHKTAMKNLTKLLIERNPWDSKEMAVPYPTNFHPQSDSDLIAWQNHIRGLQRNALFSFAGAPRNAFTDDFRGILFEQCRRAATQCRSLDCANGTCDDSQKALELFMDSTFCLQPRGDSFTRRSTFDCLLAGSIPVFFWHRSAYMQYEWHLPADEGSYSVFIPRQDVRNGIQIEDVLKAISPEKVKAMQEAVIQLVPKIVYAISDFAIKERDAFDVAIEGVMKSLHKPTVSAE